MGTLAFEDSDVKSFLLLNRAFRVGVDQTGQYLDIEPDLRHAPLIISESGCNTNTKAVRTPREKLQDKLVLDGRRIPILMIDEATRYTVVHMRLSYLTQDRLDLAETAMYQDLGIPMKIEIQSDSSTANSLTDRLGGGQRTKHIDTRFFWI